MAPLYQRLLVGTPLAAATYFAITCPCSRIMSCHWSNYWYAVGTASAFVLIFNYM